jgi:hypothetical protein
MNEAVDTELQDTKYPHLKLMRGGKGPPEAPSTNWLKDRKKGEVFSCKDKTNGLVMLLRLVYAHTKTYILADALNSNPPMGADADFCKRFIFIETLEEGDKPQEISNDSVRTLRPSGMEDDADAEGRQPPDESA